MMQIFMRSVLMFGAIAVLLLSGCAAPTKANEQGDGEPITNEQAIIEYLSAPAEINAALQKVGARCMSNAGYSGNDGYEARLRAHENISDFTGSFESREDAEFRGYPATLWISSLYPRLSYLTGNEHRAMYGGSGQELDSRNLRIQKYNWGRSSAEAAQPAAFTPIDTSADPAVYGCKGVAIAKVFESLENYAKYEALYPELVNLGPGASEQTRKFYDEKHQQYQQCMVEAGMSDFTAPPLISERAGAYARSTYRGSGVRTNDKEQKLAGADYECDQKLNYFSELTRIVLEQNRDWVSQHGEQIQQVHRIRVNAREQAKNL